MMLLLLADVVKGFNLKVRRAKWLCTGMVKDANKFYLVTQIAFMKQLMAEGVSNTTDVVFLDMDALVVDSITEVRLSILCFLSQTCICCRVSQKSSNLHI